MGKSIQVRVDVSLQQSLENIRKNIAKDIKKKYNLESITINGTAASRIAAAKLSGKNVINFKVEKVGLNKGVLKLL